MKRSMKIKSLVVVLMLGSFQHSSAQEESSSDSSKDMMSRLFPKGAKRKYLSGTNGGEKFKHLPPPPIRSECNFDDYFGEGFSLAEDVANVIGWLREIGESKEKELFQNILKRYCPFIEKLIQDARALAQKVEKISIDDDPQVARMLSNVLPQGSLESLKISKEKECE